MTEHRYAILVANSKYQDSCLKALQCPENDVDGLNEVLTLKGEFTEIIVLKNKPHDEVLFKINQVLRDANQEPHPKGWGMLLAASPAFGNLEIV